MTGSVTYRCPVCLLALPDVERGYECENGHRFDRARDGYVNLLPAGRLKGRPAGDSSSMIAARRMVFDAGLYDPIIHAVADRVVEAMQRRPSRVPAVLDCGCGEGTYLAAAVVAAENHGHESDGSGIEGWGIDISKPAVRLAGRRHRHLRFAVASTYALPFGDDCFDVVLSVFSPRPFAEMMRVLVPGGTAVVVTPGPDHMREFKSVIYADHRRHRVLADDDADRWPIEPLLDVPITFEVSLGEPRWRTALLEMTPFWWSAPPVDRAAIAESVSALTVDMHVGVYERSG